MTLVAIAVVFVLLVGCAAEGTAEPEVSDETTAEASPDAAEETADPEPTSTLNAGVEEPPPGMDANWVESVRALRDFALGISPRAEALGFEGSQFVLDILADWDISAAEVQEVWTRTNECAAEIGAFPVFETREEIAANWAGWEHLIPEGEDIFADWWMVRLGVPALEGEDMSSSESMARMDAVMEALVECVRKYNGDHFGIVDLYFRRAEGSLAPPTPEQQVACLVRNGWAPEGLTTQDLAAVQAELAWPTTCEGAQADPRFSTVTCMTAEEQEAGWGIFSAEQNLDWVFESRVAPGTANLNEFPAAGCIWDPENN